MPIAPPQPGSALDGFNQLTDPGPRTFDGFQTNVVPSTSGSGTRQSRIPNQRTAVDTRHLMYWLVPEQPIVQMYINPQNVTYSDKKAISSQRSKGGYILQYWGEELSNVRLSGTTGTSGIEGINVLYDVYRNEQLAIDPYALFIAAAQDKTSIEGLGSSIGNAIGGGVGDAIGGIAGSLLQSGANAANPNASRPQPSLAQMAFSVELYWSGAVYRGYFNSFTVTEKADSLGLFDYDIDFSVTQKRGMRSNFLAWHRSATSGPSNMDPAFGTPYSYGSLAPGDAPTPRQTDNQTPSILQSVGDSLGFDIF